MKVLFDQNIPKALRFHIPGHAVSVANEIGWAAIENGELLRLAEAAAFDVLVTADQSIFYQQNNLKRKIALVVLNTNHWGRISKQTEVIAIAVDSARPSGFAFTEFEPLKKRSHSQFTSGDDA